MAEITTIISNVGFPIVACMFMYKQQVEMNNIITDLTTTLKTIDTRIELLERV